MTLQPLTPVRYPFYSSIGCFLRVMRGFFEDVFVIVLVARAERYVSSYGIRDSK
jgi:hypothetical protein